MLALLGIAALSVILVILVVFAVYQSPRQRIGYIGLPQRVIPRVIEALELADGQTVYDLGCGDGRVVAAVLRASPAVNVVAVEVNPVVMMIAKLRLLPYRGRVRFVRGDLLRLDLAGANCIFTYLNDPTMAELEPKLPKGVRLVSCDFPLPNTKPTHVIKVGEKWQLGQQLFIYKL